MTDRISVLRGRLQLCCQDLNLLSLKDLTECKWTTQKKIFLALLSASSRFQESTNKLQSLIEQRNAEIAHQKAESINDRSIIAEHDCRFRTSFMRTVLEMLTQLKWPPTTRAFSDPFDELCHDRSVTLDAIEHIVNVAFQHENATWTTDAEFNSPNKKLIAHQKKKTVLPIYDNISLTNPNTSPRIQSTVASSATPSPAHIPSTSNSSASNSIGDARFAQHFTLDAKESPPMGNYRSLEILQKHVDVLSKQMKYVQEAILVRDGAETQLSAIIHDLIRTIEDLTAVGVGGKRQETLIDDDRGISKSDGHHSTESNIKSSKSVRADPISMASRNDGFDQTNANRSFDTPKNQTIGSTQQSLIWSKVLHRLRDIEQQWSGARSEIRKRVGSVSELSPVYNTEISAAKHYHDDLSTSLYVSDTLGGVAAATARNKGDEAFESSSGTPRVMNSSHIHKLRYNLFHLSEKLFLMCSAQSKDVSSPSPEIRDFYELANTASDILLSVASMGTLGQSDLFPSRGLTGLEELIDLVKQEENLANPRKMPEGHGSVAAAPPFKSSSSKRRVASTSLSATRVQQIIDRAVAEQVATVRCLHQARSFLEEWIGYGTRLEEMLGRLGQSYEQVVAAAVRDVRAHEDAISDIARALQKVDGVVASSSGNHNNNNNNNSSSSSTGTGLMNDEHISVSGKKETASVSTRTVKSKMSNALLQTGTGLRQAHAANNSSREVEKAQMSVEMLALLQALRYHQPKLAALSELLATVSSNIRSILHRDVAVIETCRAQLRTANKWTRDFHEFSQKNQ